MSVTLLAVLGAKRHYIWEVTGRARALGNRSANLKECCTCLKREHNCPDFLQVPFIKGLTHGAELMFDEWRPTEGGSRIRHNGIKVAMLSAMANHQDTVDEDCLAQAIVHQKWQVELRKVWKPGEAKNLGAEFRTAALRAFERKGKKFVNWKRLSHDNKWGGKYGDWIVKSGIQNLVDVGELVPEIEVDEDGHEALSKTRMRLRTEWGK
jgi:hypothetical protein